MKRSNHPLLAAASLLLAAPLWAHAAPAASVEAQYQSDRAACLSGVTGQALKPCLAEAAAARALALNHPAELARPSPSQAEHNRLERCDPLPADQRADCVRRIDGEGSVEGSVEGGGILRTLVTRSVEPTPGAAETVPVAPAPAPAPAPRTP